MQTKFIIFIILVVLIVGGLGIFFELKTENPGKLDAFAQCIKESGAEFYGSFGCSHCQGQKTLFGSSKKYLPYIECSNIDETQTQVCIDKKIESVPTWFFKDGSVETGKLSLEKLSYKTGCPLPQ